MFPYSTTVEHTKKAKTSELDRFKLFFELIDMSSTKPEHKIASQPLRHRIHQIK